MIGFLFAPLDTIIGLESLYDWSTYEVNTIVG
jgi:hypothetical protein